MQNRTLQRKTEAPLNLWVGLEVTSVSGPRSEGLNDVSHDCCQPLTVGTYISSHDKYSVGPDHSSSLSRRGYLGLVERRYDAQHARTSFNQSHAYLAWCEKKQNSRYPSQASTDEKHGHMCRTHHDSCSYDGQHAWDLNSSHSA